MTSRIDSESPCGGLGGSREGTLAPTSALTSQGLNGAQVSARLVLLTGPAAGEVAAVFREMALGTCCANRDGECFQPGCPQLRDGEPKRSGRSCPVPWPHHFEEGEEPGPTWDEMRDYWQTIAPIGCAAVECYGKVEFWRRPVAPAVEAAIRSFPGGEEWLVGLVLPTPHPYINLTCGHTHWRCSLQWGCKVCRGYYRLPARLAILAPDAPTLLVERVRAWGGEVWWCSRREEPTDCLITCDKWIPPHPAASADYDVIEDTWPEAVRAALGEVAP